MNKQIILIFTILLTISFSMAQLTNGSKTLFHTQTGNTFNQGHFNVNASVNFFSKAADYIGDDKPADFQVENYWLIASNIVATYGIVEHFDATLGIRLYQDTYEDDEYNLPGDLFLTLRAGSIPFGQNHFQNAFLASMRFPIGKEHNYPLAEYASGSFEYGLMYAVSFFSDAYLPKRAVGVHFNIGWWNHNESGTTFKFSDDSEIKANRNSNDIRLALALAMPSRLFDFRIEATGILYLRKPNNFIYSAEEWAYLTPSIRYKPIKGLNFDLGFDFRLSPGDRQWTKADIPDFSENLDLSPNYPPWKFHFGVNMAMDFMKSGGALTSEKNYQREEARERIELFEKILEERKKTNTIQNELENLRKIRKETDVELEEIKNILDE